MRTTNFDSQTQVDFLKKILADKDQKIEHQDAKILRQETEIQKRDRLIAVLEEKLKLALIRKFARMADTYVDPNAPKQANLFDEMELMPDETPAPPEAADLVSVAAHTKKTNRGKRNPLPAELERVVIIHALPESELIGKNGEQFVEIGREITEQLDITPADVKVIQHVRIKYAVKTREELGVKLAPMPEQIIPKSIASAGLLAHIAQAKYCYHLPLYRQEQIWRELDVHLPRNSACRWMMQVGEKMQTLVEYLFENMKRYRHMHVDESPLTVIDDDRKKPENPSHQGFLWVYANPVGVVYDYQSSREGAHPLEMLSEFKGYVQSDGYAGYNGLFTDGTRISVGCMAHARRKFTDVQKLAGKKSNTPVADSVVNLMGKLYHLEEQAKKQGLTINQIYELRQEKAKRLLDRLHQYLKEQQPKAPPQGQLAKAINYTLNQWDALIRYLDDGIINIDNNPAERCIKPFAVGRKNWLFCGNTRGARAAANLYSLIQSAKLHDLKIFDYLKYVFEQLPSADTPRKLEQLLPQYAATHLPKIKKSQKQSG